MIKLFRIPFLVPIAFVLSFATVANAQDESDDIENLFNKEEQVAPQTGESSTTSETKTETRTSTTEAPVDEIKGVSDLGKLSTFSDVAVIQRRYLPKTGRFELYAAPSLVMNDAFFLNFGLNGRVGYNFSERYGIEFVGYALTTSEREVTKDLRQKRGVTTTSLITPKSYLGLDFKWTPIYGKMTWRNHTITPFDLYFSLGGGMTSTNQSTSEPTLHFGTGQIFALGKSSAFRWDFSWNMFQAASSVSAAKGTSLYNTLLISMGFSFFFPEASYR